MGDEALDDEGVGRSEDDHEVRTQGSLEEDLVHRVDEKVVVVECCRNSVGVEVVVVGPLE